MLSLKSIKINILIVVCEDSLKLKCEPKSIEIDFLLVESIEINSLDVVSLSRPNDGVYQRQFASQESAIHMCSKIVNFRHKNVLEDFINRNLSSAT